KTCAQSYARKAISRLNSIHGQNRRKKCSLSTRDCIMERHISPARSFANENRHKHLLFSPSSQWQWSISHSSAERPGRNGQTERVCAGRSRSPRGECETTTQSTFYAPCEGRLWSV